MNPASAALRAGGALMGGAVLGGVFAALFATATWAQTPSAVEKMNAYVGCINRLSARAYQSRDRYFMWAARTGPTGRERIIYGTYTIYDTADCKKAVEKANALEPRDAALEAAATEYAEAVGKLEPLLKVADDYYTQENYKDDKMELGKALHSRLVAAWEEFAAADMNLRNGVETINDRRALEKLAAIEQEEGKSTHYHVEALMIRAKSLMRSESASPPDLAAITKALNEYEAIVKATEESAAADGGPKIGSIFIGSTKSFLTTAKQLMRRLRDKTPYSQGDLMMMNSGGGWMIEGSPQRLTRDYNQLVDAYNRGPGI
jgi:hypothetical protein